MKVALFSLVAVLACLAMATWWALESDGVAILETQGRDGSHRSVHVWFAEHDGEIWLEAGTPERSWYLDVLHDPHVSFSATRHSGRFFAQRIEDPGAHDEIRSLLRKKYGVRDWWIALLFDTSRSIAVRLLPMPEESPAASL